MEYFVKYKKIIFRLLEYFKTKSKKTLILASLVFVFSIFSLIWYATATEPTNIKAEYKFAWSENAGWLNFGSGDGGVMVGDSALTGYIWSENLGWISLNCSNNNSCAVSNYKVANDSEGNLSGYAWGENIGWVNFAPTNEGVHIDSEGVFSGYAWSENAGWIVFSCGDVDSCATADFGVKTTWLPLSVRNQNSEEETSGVEVSDVHYSSTDTTIVINWDTNHNADSHVSWGTDKNLEKEKNENQNERKHRITLRDLEPNTQYYFRAKSTDGNDSSDSSRIYAASTKPSSAIFASRQWESFNEDQKSENDYEKVDIGVSDKSKNEEKQENLNQEKRNIPEKNAQNFESKKGGNFISGIFSFLGEKIKSSVSGAWNGIAYAYNSIYDSILSGQRMAAKFIGDTGEKIANAYGNIISKFSKEKANQIAKLHQAKFFTTQVFTRNEKKMLSEVRFQILDKSDNPIPRLETMLFSDPQNSVTDENGIASFQDVPLGSHTLAFEYQGENFEKKVAIADTLTDEGKVRAEIVQVKAEKEKIEMWMWGIIILLIIAVLVALYFARQYFKLKKQKQD